MKYCPKCGTSLKAEMVSKEIYEKYEKHEKEEKEEKAEKHEKEETTRFWTLIFGLIIITFGIVSLITTVLNQPFWPFFLMIVGILIIIFVIHGAAKASRRHPRP